MDAMIKASDGSIAAAYDEARQCGDGPPFRVARRARQYDAYGRTLRESGDYAEANPFRFSTKYTDIETGLIYHDTRYYSPTLGRFITRDTIGEQGGINLYAYVRNGVPNAWDYLGMNPWLAQDGREFSSFEGMVAYNDMLVAQDELYWLEYEDGYGDRQAFRRFLYDPHAGLSATGRAEALTYYVESFRTTDGRTVPVASGTTLQHFENGQVVVSSDLNATAVGTVSLSGGGTMPSGIIFAGETTMVDAWHDPVVTRSTVTEIPVYWAGREDAFAAAYGSVWDRDRQNARRVDDWTAIQTAAQDTFGNAVFQQPFRTLATAGVQVTALVGTAYAGVANAPAIARGTITAARTVGNAATQLSARGYQYAMANPYRTFETGNFAIGYLQSDGTLPPITPGGAAGAYARLFVDNIGNPNP